MLNIEKLAEDLFVALHGKGLLTTVNGPVVNYALFDLVLQDSDVDNFAKGTGVEFVIQKHPAESISNRNYYCLILTTEGNEICFCKREIIDSIESWNVICTVILEPKNDKIIGFLLPKSAERDDLRINASFSLVVGHEKTIIVGFDDYPDYEYAQPDVSLN